MEDKTCTVIMEAKRILIEDGWIQGSYHTLNGYCVVGAIGEAVGNLRVTEGNAFFDVTEKIMASIPKPQNPSKPSTSLVAWNDAKTRTKKQVIALLDKACNV